MKVLFCVDGSEASIYAVKKALCFLRKEDQIDIINIIDWGLIPTYVTFQHEEEEGSSKYQNLAQNLLNRTREIIESYGYSVTKSEFSYGHPDVIILDLIKSENYNLVVLGSHGKKGLRSWLGSVSRKVVTKSPVPTLIARPPKEHEKALLLGSKEILITVDGSEYSYNAIKCAISLLNLDESSIEILTVIPGAESLPIEITMDNEWLESCLNKQKEIAQEILDKSKAILKEKNLTPKATLAIEGNPADVILDYIEKNNKDMLIMGSHGREGISELLLGSVSKRVLDHSTSPVLIIPSKKKSVH